MVKKKSNWPLLILFVVFVILTAYIIMTSLSIYQGAKSTVGGTNPNIYCTRFSFDVEEESIEYSNKALSFEIKNNYGDEIEAIGIAPDDKGEDVRFVNFTNFYRNTKRKVILGNFDFEKNFSVFPAGCYAYNKKTFSRD